MYFSRICNSGSQSAVIPNTKRLQQQDRILTRGNVRYDKIRYAFWWALTHSEGDPFGRRKGKDGVDWTVTAGCKDSKRKHPIDPVRLYFPDLDSTHIGTHSFRRFGATYAKLRGVPDDETWPAGRQQWFF
jgi:hypothetical protein